MKKLTKSNYVYTNNNKKLKFQKLEMKRGMYCCICNEGMRKQKT